MSDSSHIQSAVTRAGELADIAAMDRLARDLAPESSLRRYARGLGYGGALSTRSRRGQQRRHVRLAR